MHWQVVDDIPRPESQDVRLASVETESTGPRPFFNVDQAAFKSLESGHHSVRRLAT